MPSRTPDPAVIVARNRLNAAARWHRTKQTKVSAEKLARAREAFEITKQNRELREAAAVIAAVPSKADAQ
jgi:hypothetical protein